MLLALVIACFVVILVIGASAFFVTPRDDDGRP